MVRLVFRPYTQLRRSICTSESLRSSTRVSPGIQPGHANSNDFVALELRKGKVRLLLDQGNGVSELKHDTNIGDGRWHKITTVFRSDRLEISVDGNNTFSAPNKGTNKHIDLTDRLFIGGMELKKKTRAIRKAFKTNALRDEHLKLLFFFSSLGMAASK